MTYNPVIPYCDRIGYPLNIGTLVRISGTSHPTARCFAINFQCGPSINPRDDLALHLSPVFTAPPRVVRNSLQGQRWGPEESFGGFPFIGGQPFELLILVESDNFKIAINGQHFTEFRHRLPLNRISHLSIDGDVSIASIIYELTQPTYAPPSAPIAPIPPYPAGGSGHYVPPPVPGYATGYPPQSSYPPNPPVYPTGGYPTGGYPTAGYPTAGYPTAGYAPQGYPHSPNNPNKGILGGLGGALGGLTAGAAASSIGSAILGKGKHHGIGGHHSKHSSPIPIAGLAAGAGAAALGAAVLTGHHPFKKAKKMFKHKGFKHKWHKPKFGKWKHKGWSSGSSSSE
ncbi:galectin-4-like [Oppia nitens]|uniref:galectin-4-like n=1 Tax=Oppia nitens TaxID=1686743 RepID=UPI0023DA11E0|nr:galectin-4-like [Oppia nitens]